MVRLPFFHHESDEMERIPLVSPPLYPPCNELDRAKLAGLEYFDSLLALDLPRDEVLDIMAPGVLRVKELEHEQKQEKGKNMPNEEEVQEEVSPTTSTFPEPLGGSAEAFSTILRFPQPFLSVRSDGVDGEDFRAAPVEGGFIVIGPNRDWYRLLKIGEDQEDNLCSCGANGPVEPGTVRCAHRVAINTFLGLPYPPELSSPTPMTVPDDRGSDAPDGGGLDATKWGNGPESRWHDGPCCEVCLAGSGNWIYREHPGICCHRAVGITPAHAPDDEQAWRPKGEGLVPGVGLETEGEGDSRRTDGKAEAQSAAQAQERSTVFDTLVTDIPNLARSGNWREIIDRINDIGSALEELESGEGI